MPDFGAPVAQNVDGPTQGLQTLSDLMNLQRTQQAVQLGQQALQRGAYGIQESQAQAQGAQQAMQTRQKLQQISQSGVDDQGNNIRMQNGELDPGKFAAAAVRIDPLNGSDQASKVVQAATDRATLKGALMGLDSKQRGLLAGPVQAASLNPDADHLQAARDTVNSWVAQHPEMGEAGTSALRMIDKVQAAPDAQTRSKLANSLSAMFQPGQQVQTQPERASVTTGPTIQQGTVAPPAAGGGFTATTETTVAPPPQYITNQFGVPVLTGMKGQAAAGAGQARPATGMPSSLPTFPTNQQVADWSASRDRTNAAISTGRDMPNYIDSIDHAMRAVKDAPAGSFGPGLGNWERTIGPYLGGGTDWQTANAYLDRIALQAQQALGGPNTNAGLEAAKIATGTVAAGNRDTLLEKLRQIKALSASAASYNSVLGRETNFTSANPNYLKEKEVTSAWANASPALWRLHQDMQAGDQADIDHLLGNKDKGIQGVYGPTDAASLKKQLGQMRQYIPDLGNLGK